MSEDNSDNDSVVNVDGIKLFRMIFNSASGTTKTIVFLCHGLFEHCQACYYEPIIKHLNAIDCLVVTHDHMDVICSKMLVNGKRLETAINSYGYITKSTLNEDSSLNNPEIDQRTSHLEPSTVNILIRDKEEILNLEDDAINFLNEYVEVGYVEEISGDEYGSFDDNNLIEYEYQDLMTDITFPGYKERNLLVAHEEIIAILNEMEKDDPKEINESSALLKESQANSNEMNSNTKTELSKLINTSVLENSLKIDSRLYCLILILETYEDEYYPSSRSKTRKPIYRNQLFSKDWYEELSKSNLSEMNCRSFSSDFIVNVIKIKKSIFLCSDRYLQKRNKANSL